MLRRPARENYVKQNEMTPDEAGCTSNENRLSHWHPFCQVETIAMVFGQNGLRTPMAREPDIPEYCCPTRVALSQWATLAFSVRQLYSRYGEEPVRVELCVLRSISFDRKLGRNARSLHKARSAPSGDQ